MITTKEKIEINKGITLIALIITIIVLLILAGISIATLTGDNGILSKAQEAKTKHEEESKKEEERIQDMADYIENLDGNKDAIAKYVKVGDYIQYGEKLQEKEYVTKVEETGYTNVQTFQTDKTTTWRVMNITPNGEVEIVASSNTLTDGGNTGLYLKGRTGFKNAKTILNNMCQNLYTSSYGSGRNIKVEDINNLVGYIPGEQQIFSYASGWAFYDKEKNEFRMPSAENPVVVKATTYTYMIDTKCPMYDTLVANTFCPDGDVNAKENTTEHYWLSDDCIHCVEDRARFGWRDVKGGRVDGVPLYVVATNWEIGEGTYDKGVRPVVMLSKNATLDFSSDMYDGTTPQKAWRLK